MFLLPFPRFLSGFRLGDWFRLLRAHRFRVDPPFWPRAVLATLGCAITSCLARLEHLCTRGEVDPELWEKPVFILGLPRSGTSHLFELLAQSPQLCFPTRFDAFKPHTFLFLRRAGLFAVLNKLPRFKRVMDNVRIGWGSPEEDVVALTVLTSLGERINQVFPRDRTNQGSSGAHAAGHPGENLELLRSLRAFSRKLVLLHSRRVLLKSPGHIGRVREILEVFPEAKFVTIFRNPLHQMASLHDMRHSGNPFWCALQWPAPAPRAPRFEVFGMRLRRYFDARPLIPAGNLVELTFEELVSDRVRTITRICTALDLVPPTASDRFQSNSGNERAPRSAPLSWTPSMRECFRPLYDAGFYPTP